MPRLVPPMGTWLTGRSSATGALTMSTQVALTHAWPSPQPEAQVDSIIWQVLELFTQANSVSSPHRPAQGMPPSAMTLMLGFVCKGMNPRYRTPEDTFLGSVPTVRIPSEALVHDLLIRDDVFPSSQRPTPEVEVYHDFNCEPFGEPHRDYDRLPLRESVIYLGRGPEVLANTASASSSQRLMVPWSKSPPDWPCPE